MLREPGSLYVPDRSMTCLKVKTFYDAEGVIIGYQPGRGKHKGRVGALICRRPDGVEFEVGTGLSDKERQTPPAVGVTITYSYKELTDAGKPRHASFIAVRDYE
jgi:DNA ligase-1